MDGEQRRLGDASKNLRKAERRIKELDFQAKIYIPNTIRTQKKILHFCFFRADMAVLKISAI